MNDEDVADTVRRAAGGDATAWNRLVECISPLLWNVARGYRLDTDECAAAVQFAWFRLVQHLEGIENRERVRGWLVATVRHECLRTFRRNERERPDAGCDDVADVDGVDDRLRPAERRAIMRAALAALDPRDQKLLTLLAITPPLPYAQVGRRMGMPTGSVAPTRQRALGRLRTQLTALGVMGESVG